MKLLRVPHFIRRLRQPQRSPSQLPLIRPSQLLLPLSSRSRVLSNRQRQSRTVLPRPRQPHQPHQPHQLRQLLQLPLRELQAHSRLHPHLTPRARAFIHHLRPRHPLCLRSLRALRPADLLSPHLWQTTAKVKIFWPATRHSSVLVNLQLLALRPKLESGKANSGILYIAGMFLQSGLL